jgi:hypothetical protein
MPCPRALRWIPLLALAACVDDPTTAPTPQPPPVEKPKVMGVYEFTLTGIGTPDAQASVSPVAPGGASFALTPRNTGLALETVSSSSFTEGTRGQGGHRYINVTFRIRNSTGAPVSNLTFIPSMSNVTIAGTPFVALIQFNGTFADPAVASAMVPTGALTMGAGNGIRASDVDVLQVFQESELTGISVPPGVTGLMPYGFVTRSINSSSSRTLPNTTDANEFSGLVTLAFRYPLTASSNTDPFQISFQALAVEDSETRMTESIEEGQDTSAVRRIRERAAALGATVVTVLPGSTATAPEVVDYPGQRQICSVRTAGTAGSPVTFITNAAAYTRINLLRQGETTSACGAYFRGGSPTAPIPGSPHTLTLVAQDRYGNTRLLLDSVRVERISGPTVTTPGTVVLSNGQAGISTTFGAYGTSHLRLVGRRIRDERLVEVGTSTVAALTGRSLTGTAGTAMSVLPSVTVRNNAGTPIPNRQVTFTVTQGGGTITGAVVNTDINGNATLASWMLGADANLNTVTATVAGPGVQGNPMSFNVAGCTGPGTGYNATVCFTSPVTASQRTVFTNAATRWQELITGDLANVVTGNVAAGSCGPSTPGFNLTIDDLLIFAGVVSIDGPGGILGSAGPCFLRVSGSLPVVGVMEFDAADVAALEAGGQLGSVILHEMGHVIGIGSLWTTFGLLQNPSSTGSALDTYFSGGGGLTGFNNIGGSTYTGGNKVPVENTGGPGTMNAHWRESVLQNELMTGYLNAGANPLSQLTVRSLGDMGYTVNPAAADAFFLTLSLQGDDVAPRVRMMNDVRTGPIYRIDEQGRTSRVQ